MEPLIKISSVLRIRVLFSFVKKITIYPDKDCGNPKGRNNFASFHLYDWLDHLNYIPLPNLESLCLCGTRSKPYYPSLATGLLNLLCKPKSLCCKWLDPVYELGNLISLAWDHSLEKIIIHGADQMHFPPTGNYSVRFSIVLHGNENILENAFRILGSLDHPHLKDTFGPWRIVGGDGLILESSRDVNEMVDYMCQIGEDRSERSSSSSEESDANEKVDDRGKMMVFLDKLSATKRGEEESEPPCEVCGGTL
ncbi:uncharacterized protein L201_004315 [Kwoniella dendrophila CBS 6074]|uniref:Uncharacterized protein n=1 Tax=Kwoniella dendrophila CBS 6074 TaxID=1295534 RepID=A0AAX4JVJ9_9TREE